MEEISLRDIISILLRGKWLIAAILIVCMIIIPIGTVISMPSAGKAQMIIALNFPGIENGQNPDGSKFEIDKIKSPVVVDGAVRSLGLKDISTEKVRNSIGIEPLISSGTVDRIKAARERGEDVTYYPSEYIVSYKVSDSIDVSTGKQILQAIVSRYSDYFNDLYTDRTVLENTIGQIDYTNYDYPEISIVMYDQISRVISFISEKSSEAAGFRANGTGLTFSDILGTMNVLRNIELNKLSSSISAVNLTKDKEKLIKSYEYRIKMLQLEKSKKSSESQVAEEMMDSYKRQQNVIMIPGLGTEKLEAEEKESYYDKLAERSTDAGVAARNSTHDIAFYQREIAKLKDDKVSDSLKDKAKAEVEQMIPQIKENLNKWIDLSNKTLVEYYEYKYDKSIKEITGVDFKQAISMKLVLAISLVLGLMLGVFVVFFREYWKNGNIIKESVKAKATVSQ